MPAIVGTSGSVVFTAMSASSPAADSIVEASVRRWTANITRSSNEANTFSATSSARVRLGGVIRLTGSLDGWLDTTQVFLPTDWNASILGTTYAATADGFVLNASSKGGTQRIQYKFAGWLSGLRVGVRRAELNSFTCDFVSTGTITSTAVA
jgi:hypothetical protein